MPGSDDEDADSRAHQEVAGDRGPRRNVSSAPDIERNTDDKRHERQDARQWREHDSCDVPVVTNLTYCPEHTNRKRHHQDNLSDTSIPYKSCRRWSYSALPVYAYDSIVVRQWRIVKRCGVIARVIRQTYMLRLSRRRGRFGRYGAHSRRRCEAGQS